MLKKILPVAYVISWLVLLGLSIARYAKIFAGQCAFFTDGWLMCAPQSQLSSLEKFGLVFLIVSVFVCFLLAAILFWKNNDSTSWLTKKLKWLLLGLGIAAVFVVPLGTSDMPYYFSAGKTISQNLNPYFDQWIFQVDFSSPLLRIPENGFSYGPIMAGIFLWLYNLSGGQVLIFILLWKFFMLAALAGCGILTMKLANLFSNNKDTAAWYMLWFAQPIFLFEWVVNGHFDGLWLFFLLLAIYAAHSKRWWLVIPALTIGVWIKFIPIFVFPFFALWWWQSLDKQTWKKSIWQMGLGLVIAGLITVLSWRPYWVGPHVFDAIILQSKWAVMSIFSVIYYSLKPLFVWLLADQAHWYLTRLVQGGLLLTIVYLLYPIIKKCFAVLFRKEKLESREYVQMILILLAVYMMMWQKSFWPWYGVWLIPLALIVYKTYRHPSVLKIAAWFSLAAPLYHIIIWVTLRNDAPYGDNLLWFFYLTVGSAMLYPLYLIFRWRQKSFANK